jgi:hypothetical protein
LPYSEGTEKHKLSVPFIFGDKNEELHICGKPWYNGKKRKSMRRKAAYGGG